MDYDPASEINDIAPSSLNHLIGQRRAIEQVRIALDAAQMDGNPFPNTLLLGAPGTGKSQLASVIAAEMAADFSGVLGQSLKGGANLNALLLSADRNSVIHIDECHLLSKENQTALFLAIDKKSIVIGKRNGKKPQIIPLNDISILLSTTDEHMLLQPLRDRCKLMLRMEFYSADDLAILISVRAKILRWKVCTPVIHAIAERARQTPRIGLRMLQSCRRVCRSLGEHEITVDHLEKVCELEQIDCHGLDPDQQRFLKLLLDGESKLNVIASHLGLPNRTLTGVVEPFLIRAGFITKDQSSGRQLTAFGRGHATDLCNKCDQ